MLGAIVTIYVSQDAPHARQKPTANAMTQLKRAHTTLFWCGESANANNKQITNIESYWCDDWVYRFGGVDHPRSRRGFHPASFSKRKTRMLQRLDWHLRSTE
jgi:hypothetical protein